MACQTQWRFAAMGGPTGLDYSGVELVIRSLGHPLRILQDVQDIERGALLGYAKARQINEARPGLPGT